jgi:hypothetical protein
VSTEVCCHLSAAVRGPSGSVGYSKGPEHLAKQISHGTELMPWQPSPSQDRAQHSLSVDGLVDSVY